MEALMLTSLAVGIWMIHKNLDEAFFAVSEQHCHPVNIIFRYLC